MNIYVSNLNFKLQDEDLRSIFTPFGEVSSAKIIRDNRSGRSRGFGFIEMPNDDDARTAIEKLNGTEVEGRIIVVNEARPRREGSNDNNRGFKKRGEFNRQRNFNRD
jgi:RNA recognition motif-containing protein